MVQRRRAQTQQEKSLWAELGHILLLSSIAQCTRWGAKELIFHGGTSLHSAWGSPRFSEDLDFLLNEELLNEVREQMPQIVRTMQRHLLRLDADLKVELKDKSSDRMARFNISLYKENVIGRSMVKAEFWAVTPNYLEQYKSTPKQPQPDMALEEAKLFVRVRALLPTATLDSVFCDKLVAMAGRDYIKWRDIFDLWWIQQQRDFERPHDEEIAQRVDFHASAYRSDTEDESAVSPYTQGLPDRLRQYAQDITTPEALELAKKDLRRFLTDISGSTHLWDMYWPDTVQEMANHAAQTCLEVADFIEELYVQHERHSPLQGMRATA